MFADDIKLYSSSKNYRDLERDLRAIYDWTHDWLLPLNLDKCIVLHLGNNNPKHVHFVDNLRLSCTDSHVDLGVLSSPICHGLSTSSELRAKQIQCSFF
ncbi:hypothetical protein Zmor_021689 [Zophobas morio]|uniref:Reverse transcriptase domain-containing protein n=1 Tax=Zophobas morio TaxID=2755281 RepID=A0AA38I8P1_9CUCU|nr:hypothetical protein Zmor_021689 [Zophobas morio]